MFCSITHLCCVDFFIGDNVDIVIAQKAEEHSKINKVMKTIENK